MTEPNVYRAISELQTVLVGIIQDSRKESHSEHLTLLSRVEGIDERVRTLEQRPIVAAASAAIADDQPVFQLTWRAVKRWGLAATAIVAVVTGMNLIAEAVLRFLAWMGFHR